MNIQIFFYSMYGHICHSPLILVILVVGITGTAVHAAPRSGNCWVDIYNAPDYSGTRARIFGPVELPRLQDINGVNWNDAIESLEVGPGAEVSIYENENFDVPGGPVYHEQELRSWGNKDENFRSSVASFTQGHKVHHLGEYGLHHQVSALKVRCMD